MGEEANQELTQTEVAKPEQKKTEEKKEEKPAEEKVEEPEPVSPFVLFVDLHCAGCAKKIEKSIIEIRGVEGVAIDMAQNQVTIKGIVEPQAVCNRIMKKTKRRAKVLSPLPEAEGEPMSQIVTSKVSGSITVELNVNMHCEACAEQLRNKILKMRGVQTAITELNTGKVTVTGTMDANKLVEYIYRRTKKQAQIVPQPEPAPEPAGNQEVKKEGEHDQKAAPANEEAKPGGGDEKKQDPEAKSPSENEAADCKPNKEEEEAGDQNNNKDAAGGGNVHVPENEEEGGGGAKKEAGEGENSNGVITANAININDEESLKRVVYYYGHQPLYYVIEKIPPPPLFSDENPNACTIL